MSVATLLLLRRMLAAQQLQVGADDFAEVSRQVVVALAELDVALAAADGNVSA